MITSLQNSNVKEWVRLHKRKYREEAQLFLIEEQHMIEEAMKAKVVKTLIVLEGKENIFDFDGELIDVNEQVMSKLSTNQSGVSYIALCEMSKVKKESNFILLLDAIQDPGNLGTLLRSALAFGFHQIVLGEGCVDLYNDKVLRSTQGALFELEIVQRSLQEKIPLLKKEGYQIYGTTLQEALSLQEVNVADKLAIVLGNEGQGVQQEILDLCDYKVKIEMETFESLNVGVAGSIGMYHFMVKSLK